ncbi:unnamed protein product [Moneuplotes crassus]|uniref:Uncharacterized protein n=1 Tax=Euplotes crassus TaxID=5936 RepID=A0AAD1XAH8_EUPCR|nr:unnamed protein product [Moneuplotes crassus]
MSNTLFIVNKRLRVSSPVAVRLPLLNAKSADFEDRRTKRAHRYQKRQPLRSIGRTNINEFSKNLNCRKVYIARLVNKSESQDNDTSRITQKNNWLQKSPMSFYDKISSSELMNYELSLRIRKLLKKRGFKCRLTQRLLKKEGSGPIGQKAVQAV